jgi:AcrR family transcriptional regulator
MSRATILAAAQTVFAHKGYSEGSLREIAETVGIKTPSIYAHFSSKESLYEAVYAEVNFDHTEYFEKLSHEGKGLVPIERLEYLLRGIEAYYRDRPELAEFSLRASIAEYGADGARLRELFLVSESGIADAVRETYGDAVAAGLVNAQDADGFTALFLTLMDGLFLQLTHYTPELYHQRFDATWRYLSGLLV